MGDTTEYWTRTSRPPPIEPRLRHVWQSPRLRRRQVSLASNLVMLAEAGSAGCGRLWQLAGPDGSKPVIIIAMLGTITGYAFVFAGMYGGSYWLYFLSMLWTGFLGHGAGLSPSLARSSGRRRPSRDGGHHLDGGPRRRPGAVLLVPFASGDGSSVFLQLGGLRGAVMGLLGVCVFVHEPQTMRSRTRSSSRRRSRRRRVRVRRRRPLRRRRSPSW